MDQMVPSRKLSRAVMMLPADLWFEVIDYLRVTDIVHIRAVRCGPTGLPNPQISRQISSF